MKEQPRLLLQLGDLLPGMSCPCVPGINSVIWTVGQQAGFALFLDEFAHSCAVKSCSLSESLQLVMWIFVTIVTFV